MLNVKMERSHLKEMNTTLFLIVLLNVSIAIFIIVYGGTINNYFVASPLSLSKHIISHGNIPESLYSDYISWNGHANSFTKYPGSAIIISILSLVAGIDYYIFASLPISSIFWVIALLCFIKLLIGKNIYMFFSLSLLLTIYTISSRPDIWTLSYHSLGFISHLFILFIVTKLLITNDYNRGKYVFVILLLFTTSLLNYYSASLFSTMFLFALTIWALIFKEKENSRLTMGLPVLLFVMYIAFDTMLWDVLKYGKLDFGGIFEIITSSMYRFIMGFPPSEEFYKYGYSYMVNPFDQLFSRFFRGFSPLVLLVLTYFDNEAHSISREKKMILILASLSVAIWESFPYAIFTDTFSARYLSLFTPIIIVSLAGLALSQYYKSNVVKKRIICYILLSFFILATISSVKNDLILSNVEGFGWNKKELVRYEEYITLINYASKKIPIYSNFQVSGELRLASISVGTDQLMLSIPFGKEMYGFYEALEERDIGKLSELVKIPLVMVLTRSDFTKYIYGDVYGYAVPPLDEQTKLWLKDSALNLIYSSGRLEAFFIANPI